MHLRYSKELSILLCLTRGCKVLHKYFYNIFRIMTTLNILHNPLVFNTVEQHELVD